MKICSLLAKTLASIHDCIGNIKIVQIETLQEIRNIKAHNQLHFSSKTSMFIKKSSNTNI